MHKNLGFYAMIRDILLVQKREIEEKLKAKYVERDVDKGKFGNRMIKVITGPRRAGKSFLAMHALRPPFGYANFDDERLVKVTDLDEVITVLDSLYEKPGSIVLDEVQNIGDWELFVNRLQRQGYNLIITGSNSRLLSGELATHLTGRHIPITLLPFSFREFVRLAGRELTSAETKERFSFYLTHGGYPEPAVGNAPYDEYLRTLLDSVIYKDIVKRYGIRSPRAVEDLAFYLASNIARDFSYTNLTKLTGIKSAHTIKRYISYMEAAFLFFEVPRFSRKVREQVAANKKAYCFDNGLLSAGAFSMSENVGRLYENLVAIELKRRELDGLCELYYWANEQKEEVDFLVKQGNSVKQLIQVCYNLDSPKTKERELRALVKASAEMGCGDLVVLTGGYEGEERIGGPNKPGKVEFVPIWKWLLEA